MFISKVVYPIKIWINLFFFFSVGTVHTNAQTVETVAGPNPRINNGLTVHSNGTIYSSDFFGFGFNGTRVYRTTPNGVSTLYAVGLSQPAGLVFDATGLLYVAEFSSGEISTIDSLGIVTLFVSGLSQPADLVFDSNGNLFVTNYGNGTISKITPSKVVSTFATGLLQPVGIALDENQLLHVVNSTDGKIYQVDSMGTLNLLTTLTNTPVGFMTFSKGDLYVSSTGGHLIYKVSPTGNSSVFAGTGVAGTSNGTVTVAQFTNPDGIASSFTGDTIYVSENNTNRLRRITLNNLTALDFFSTPNKTIDNLQYYPNPANQYTTISYHLSKDSYVDLQLFSKEGILLKTLFSSHQQEGIHLYKLETSSYNSGVYFCKITSNGFSETTKITIVQQ